MRSTTQGLISRKRHVAALLGVLAAITGSGQAFGDWPMARHDAKRTGAAQGTGNITTPAPYWRRYLGGTVRDMLAHDVDGDGQPEVVYLAGGQLTVKRLDDTLVWQSPPLGLAGLAGIDDLDGDGNADIVAAKGDHAFIFSASTGAVEWVEPDGEMGSLAALRLGDVNGDGRPDLLIQECGCCGINSGNPGFVYSFGAGFTPTLLWAFPPIAGCGYRPTALVDVDGQGPDEVLVSNGSVLLLLDGSSGTILGESPDVGQRIGFGECRGEDIDGMPGEEILCVVNTALAPNHRKALALKFDAVSASLQLLWQQFLAPDAGDMTWVDPFVDLNADGTIEVVLGSKDGAGVWSTRVLNAATGEEMASLPGQRVVGTAPIGPAGQSLVLTMANTTLSAWRYNSAAQTPLSLVGSLPDRKVYLEPDPERTRRSILRNRVVTVDLDADGVRDLITGAADGSLIAGYSSGQAGLTMLASHSFPAGVEPFAVWSTLPYLAVARSDGFLAVHDDTLQPTNGNIANQRPGLRMGGYYASGAWMNLQTSPIVASLDGTASEAIIVPDSRRALLRLDASIAGMTVPPEQQWQRTHAYAPAFIPGQVGSEPAIVCLGEVEPVTSTPAYYVAGLRPDGSTRWQQPIEATPFNDLVPGRFDLDGVTDIVVQWGSPSDTILRTRTLSGATGATIWNGPAVDPGAGRQPAGVSVTDWDGDGLDDVVAVGPGVRILSGMDGGLVATGGPGDSYFLPSWFDVDGDGVEEVTLHGGYSPARTLTHDLSSSVWTGADDDRPYPYGAIATCASGPLLVEGSRQYPSRLKMTPMSGAAAGASTTIVLAGGQRFPSEAAAQAVSARMGQLTSTTVHSNLTGAGRPSALVGSSDGWLYAVDPCTGQLDWSLGFDAAVGEAVYGDPDGDGIDEVIVSVADGYLYGIRHKAIDAPAQVRDIAAADGAAGQDIDSADLGSPLGCAWSAVPGAAGYQVAFTADGVGYVTSPPWQDAGPALWMALDAGLALSEEQKYRCAVRAVDADGAVSPDVASDGLALVSPMPQGNGGAGGLGGAGGSGASGGAGGAPGGGPGSDSSGGCSCRVGTLDDPLRSPAGLLGLLLLAGLRRAARRHPR